MTEYNINSQFTLLERAKRSSDGKRILEMLDVMDKFGVPDFLKDVPYFQANQGLRHRIIRTTSRPASTRRKFYSGVGSTMTTTQVLYEPVVLFEQRSEIDEDQIDTVENPNELRRQEDEGHIKGLIEDFVNAIFNDAKTSGGEYIDGLAARLGNLSYPGGSSTSLPYCWNSGASATRTSLYCIDWGKSACHALYPSGQAARGTILGVSARNKGKEKIDDSDDSTKAFYAYVSQFKKWCGLAMNDDRKFFRIANINATRSGSNKWDDDLLIEALNHSRIDRRTSRIYVNPYLKTQIDIMAKDKGNVQWDIVDVFGKPVPAFQGIPVRVLDETIITADEDAVT